MDHAVDSDFGAPEAEVNFFARIEFAQIELAPSMQAGAAAEILDGAGFVFPMRPQPSQRSDERGVGRLRRIGWRDARHVL